MINETSQRWTEPFEKSTKTIEENKGWVYVIENKSLPGLVKIGYTKRSPELRASELANTGNPQPYVVAYKICVDYPYRLEQKIHNHLENYREGSEWFRCQLELVIREIKKLYSGEIYDEKYIRTSKAFVSEKIKKIDRLNEIEEVTTLNKKTIERLRLELNLKKQKLQRQQFENTSIWPFVFIGFLIFYYIFANFSLKKVEGPASIGIIILMIFIYNKYQNYIKTTENFLLFKRQWDEELLELELKSVHCSKCGLKNDFHRIEVALLPTLSVSKCLACNNDIETPTFI